MAQFDGASMRTMRFRERMHVSDKQRQAQTILNQEAECWRAHAAVQRRQRLEQAWVQFTVALVTTGPRRRWAGAFEGAGAFDRNRLALVGWLSGCVR